LSIQSKDSTKLETACPLNANGSSFRTSDETNPGVQ
jgi:hypothetical protein